MPKNIEASIKNVSLLVISKNSTEFVVSILILQDIVDIEWPTICINRGMTKYQNSSSSIF